MKVKILCLFVLFLCFIAACFSDSVPSSDSVKWYSYNEGIAAGEKEGKKVFVNFYADWCTFCAKMEKETFKEQSVVEYLNEHFISIKVNTEKENDIARKHFVRGLPMTWFLEPNGEKISSLPGYIQKDMFKQILQFIHTDSYNKMTFKEYISDHEKSG